MVRIGAAGEFRHWRDLIAHALAALVFLPVAYLCSSGRWWSLAIPVLTALPLLQYGPPMLYPIAFALAIAATLWVGTRAEQFIEAEEDEAA